MVLLNIGESRLPLLLALSLTHISPLVGLKVKTLKRFAVFLIG